MLISPLTLPANLPDLIEPCLTPILDQIGQMKFADLQTSCQANHSFLKLPLHVAIDHGQNGEISALRAKIVKPGSGVAANDAAQKFACAINLAYGIKSAIDGLIAGFCRHLISQEVERRFAVGPRDLIRLPDPDLKALNESLPYRCWDDILYGADVEEALLDAVVKKEIETRAERNSAHAHIALMAKQRAALDERAAEVAEEIRIARLSRSPHWAASRYRIHSSVTDDELAALNLRHADLFSRLMDMRYA